MAETLIADLVCLSSLPISKLFDTLTNTMKRMKRVNGCIGQELPLILWRNQSPSISNSAPKLFWFHGALLLLNTYRHEPRLLNRNSFENLVEACLWKCGSHKIRGTKRRWNSAWSSCSDHSYWELHYPQYGYCFDWPNTSETDWSSDQRQSLEEVLHSTVRTRKDASGFNASTEVSGNMSVGFCEI